jgi:hypothetical protein
MNELVALAHGFRVMPVAGRLSKQRATLVKKTRAEKNPTKSPDAYICGELDK